ncbi:MAG: adenylate kinase [Chloroflexi bacterium]|nr:adenylate kinase [Chloroflexota bacterium]
MAGSSTSAPTTALYLVLLGAPGAGKGTQAQVLSQKFGLLHVSSGDLFRDNLKRETELGKLAQTYMMRGELVPDDVTIKMVAERLGRPDGAAGAMLDGFPRTPAQAAALETTLVALGGKVNLVLYIKVSPEALMERLTGRWTCRGAGAHVYHMKHNPPRQPGVCDVDGTELYQRDDDMPEKVSTRVGEYLTKTSPLIEYYRGRGRLAEIDGERPIELVTKDLFAAVEAVRR